MVQYHLPFPTQRAFVVQIHTAAEVAQGQIWGRVEHIVSGQATHFQSLEELVRFIGQVLSDEGEDAP
jgi:hypothetical protein